MADVNIGLSSDEVVLLRRLLESALGEARVEVHRTHFSPEFREEVKREESMVRGLLAKLPAQPA
jgi:hypothetical protein